MKVVTRTGLGRVVRRLAFHTSTVMDAWEPGRDLGKYRVVRRLATGGMAEIYLAESRGIEGFAKHVVLKCILPQFAASETFVKLFLNEARVTATLDHPNIAAVYDIGTHEGTYFFAMEYLHGEDVGHVLRELVKRGATLPLEHALSIGAGVAAGLHAAHEKRGVDGRGLGIVHRDVSPSNVVVTFDGGVKLVDFGVAKLTANSEVTRTGMLKGKVAYMSPEQCEDEAIDRRSDVFSLGVLLYELTTQTRLFRAESEAATLRLVIETRIPLPTSRRADYPPKLESIVLRALARKREDRFATARDVQVALEQFARQEGLVISAARLGDWMTEVFGRRPEPWIRPAATAGVAAQLALAIAPEAISNVTTPPKAALDRGPQLAPLPIDDPPASEGTPLPAVELADRRHTITRILPLAVGGALLLSFGLFALRGRDAPPIVMTPPARAAEAPSAPPPPIAPVVIASPIETKPAPVVKGAASAARKPSLRKASPPVEDRVRAAFARKEAQLLGCFARFGDPAGPPPIAIRFQVDTQGLVGSAELSPGTLTDTALGRCLLDIALATSFGPQPSAVTFRIPLSIRRIPSTPR